MEFTATNFVVPPEFPEDDSLVVMGTVNMVAADASMFHSIFKNGEAH